MFWMNSAGCNDIYIYIYNLVFENTDNSLNHSKSHTKAFIVSPPTLYFTEMNMKVPWLILVTKLRNVTFPVCSGFMHSVHRIKNKFRQCYLILNITDLIKYKQNIVKHNSINDFITMYSYIGFFQWHVLAVVMSHNYSQNMSLKGTM